MFDEFLHMLFEKNVVRFTRYVNFSETVIVKKAHICDIEFDLKFLL